MHHPDAGRSTLSVQLRDAAMDQAWPEATALATGLRVESGPGGPTLDRAPPCLPPPTSRRVSRHGVVRLGELGSTRGRSAGPAAGDQLPADDTILLVGSIVSCPALRRSVMLG